MEKTIVHFKAWLSYLELLHYSCLQALDIKLKLQLKVIHCVDNFWVDDLKQTFSRQQVNLRF